MFKVGDRVIVNGDWDEACFKNAKGTVETSPNRRGDMLVQFDEKVPYQGNRNEYFWCIPFDMVRLDTYDPFNQIVSDYCRQELGR